LKPQSSTKGTNGFTKVFEPFVSFDEIGYGLLVADGIGGMAASNVASQWLCAIGRPKLAFRL